MFKDVQKKLAIHYTALTGLILIILLTCIFMWNITSREHGETAAFQNLWLSVSSHLQMDPIISDAFLAQTEAANRAVIHVEENGSPLMYSGSWTPPTARGRLIELGLQKAAEENIEASHPPVSSSIEQSSVFQIKGDSGDSYYGRMCVMASSKSLLLLTYITPRSTLILKSLPIFLMLNVTGIICIFFVSWHLTGRALKPARDGVKKQVEFIAAASHELRSPLAVIRSAVSVLKDSPAADIPHAADETQDAPALLTNIDKECSRMARLVSDMLLLASSDAGNWTLKKQSVETDTLLIEAYESFLPLCREKHLKLSLTLPEEPLPRITADRQRLEQVLSILLDNAVSYSPEGGNITIKAYLKHGARRLSTDCERTVIEVQDRGRGIPDELKQHIFDRFYRGDASRNDKKHFGLGLSIAKELVELHGGTITVLDNPGGGSRFIVQL